MAYLHAAMVRFAFMRRSCRHLMSKEHAAAAQQTHFGENKEDDVILPVVYYEYDYVYGRASKRPMAAKCRHGAWQSIGTGSLHPGGY